MKRYTHKLLLNRKKIKPKMSLLFAGEGNGVFFLLWLCVCSRIPYTLGQDNQALGEKSEKFNLASKFNDTPHALLNTNQT